MSDISRIVVDAKKELHPLRDLYGIFFEDINHAADGGLYAEMIQNRSFEYCELDNPGYTRMTAWTVVERDGGVMHGGVESESPMHVHNTHYFRMTNKNRQGGVIGLANSGYNTGLPLRKDAAYRFSFFARRDYDRKAPVEIRLESADGKCYGSTTLSVTSMEWTKYEAELICDTEDFAGCLVILMHGAGSMCIDMVSLFPVETFCGRENGLRPDIARYLWDMKPRFMRFPGGCLTHCGDLDPYARNAMYYWKNTIGPVEHRPSKANNWRYNQTLGFGYYEFLCFCEDIGTKPLPVLPCAHNPHNMTSVPMDEIQEWIDDVLDFLEFVMGDATSRWGSVRAEMGHPAPFELEYLAIGNEETEPEFFERYAPFHKAVAERYPHLKLLNTAGPFFAGPGFDEGWESGRENGSYAVDEHYYVSPDWLLQHTDRYASDFYDPKGPKVFLGEYASWGSKLYNALCEAAYMTGFERNADIVTLTCYAPLFCNADYVNWKPDLIWFNNHETFAIPSYYTQKLFSVHQGDMTLDIRTEITEADQTEETRHYAGGFGLCSEIDSHFTNIRLNGEAVTSFDVVRGDWTVEGDCLKRRGEPVRLGHYTPPKDSDVKFGGETEDFVLEFTVNVHTANDTNRDQTRIRHGISINFSEADGALFKWSLGGFRNTTTRLTHIVENVDNPVETVNFEMADDRDYQIRIEKNGTHIICSVDGEAVIDTAYELRMERVYVSSSMDHETNEVILKAVNVRETPAELEICVENAGCGARQVKIETMTGAYTDENSFAEPEKVAPKADTFHVDGLPFRHTFAPRSVNVLRIPVL